MNSAHDATPASIVHVRVRRLGQLFNSMDPAPFWERDLDPAAARFIEDEFWDQPREHDWQLHVSSDDPQDLDGGDVQRAVKIYYERMAASTTRELRQRWKIGRWALTIGASVFLLSILLLELLERRYSGGLPRLLGEGLVVLAWVAIWLPVEQLFYDVAPLARDRRFYRRLMNVTASLRPAEHPAAS